MKINYKGDYAIKALLSLANNYNHNYLSINELSEKIDAPIKFMEQVLLQLKHGGFVESKRGNEGGYKLTRHPSRISLGEVVRFINGPIEPISCLEPHYTGCKETSFCVLRQVWKQVYESTANIIDTVSLEDLVNRSKKLEVASSYSI
jgi:Rrf2 family protein